MAYLGFESHFLLLIRELDVQEAAVEVGVREG